jgi:two-component system sensor histidine kinase KdpD
MTPRVLSPLFLTAERPSRRAGVVVAIASVAGATAVIYPLKAIAPVVSLGVVYLLAVVVISTLWGLAFGVGTAVLSAAAFNFFHLPPVGRFTLADSRNWVALSALAVTAIAIGLVAELARARAREADQRRREADLSAELARLLLGAARLEDALPVAAQRLAGALGVASASVELREVSADERRLAFPLRGEGRRIGTLLLPASLSTGERARVLERVVPALEALLSAALERETLVGEVVETVTLRRADTVKTALLRAVSHDLRSPLTAISAASEAVASPALSERERAEMAAVIEEEALRLSRLVDNLLDLSRLEAGAAEPRRDWSSVEELIRAALRELVAGPEEFSLSIDAELPLVRVDPVQMERAFVNVLENARRHSGGHPVSVRARAVRNLAGTRRRGATADGGDGEHRQGHRPAGDRMIVRVVDRGPGIPPAQLERVFEPFYRAEMGGDGHRGSGLGLSIARGFAQANAGSLHAESLPGQGATFVFELPLAQRSDEPVDAPASAPCSASGQGPAGEPRGPDRFARPPGRASAAPRSGERAA